MQLSNELSDLTRRDADVAIRPTVTPDENLVGEKLSDVEFYVYASAPAGSAYSGDHEHRFWLIVNTWFPTHWAVLFFTLSVHDQSMILCLFRIDSPFNLIR